MKSSTYFLLLLIGGAFFLPKAISAQEVDDATDDLGNVTDAFQEHFFEALKQRAIENYELALTALSQAEGATKGDTHLDAVISFERGKNLMALERYEGAEQSFMEVRKIEGDRMDVLEALYDLYYLEQDFEAAIPLVQKLMQQDEDYKEDLANLYSRTGRYDKALQVLDELDQTWGESDYRNALRTQIYRQTGNTEEEIVKLEEKIEGSAKSERDYLNLIYLYSEQGNPEKAFATAKELLAAKPRSQLVHVALYKFYLEEGSYAEAVQSMKTVFESSEVEAVQKYKVLADFIEFVNANPSYESELEKAIPLFLEASGGKVYQQLGEYYLSKENREVALRFYELGTAKDPDNFDLIKNTLLLQIDERQYVAAAKLSEEALAVFPAQPLLYLLRGVALTQSGKPETAVAILEMGVDFLLDDLKMERDFYLQLSAAHSLLGNTQKAQSYTDKANKLNSPN
ncbi:MAG: hypothetical protein CMC08_03695 [Flavobacteriaceae bacterium]|nr:hypothetical protein [Flavobacteriaceae bacterium]